MSHASSGPERQPPGDDPETSAPERRRLALGVIIILNAGAALTAWLVGSLLLRAGAALLGKA